MHLHTQYINMHLICTLRHPPEKRHFGPSAKPKGFRLWFDIPTP